MWIWILSGVAGLYYGVKKLQLSSALEAEQISLLLVQASAMPAAVAIVQTNRGSIATPFGPLDVEADMVQTDKDLLISAMANTGKQGSAFLTTAATFESKGHSLAAYSVATMGLALLQSGVVNLP